MNSSGQNQQFFAEYSLWQDSAYCRNASLPILQFAKPDFDDSIFLAPSIAEPASVNNAIERDKQPTTTIVYPWFIENYYRKTQDLVKREDLFKDPDLFYDDEEDGDILSCEEAPQPILGSNPGFAHEASPSSFNFNQNYGTGNMMQHRLENALAQPACMDLGVSMLQRMGWEGGGLGRNGHGIIEPIAPNTQYQMHSYLGLGAEEPEVLPTPTKNRKPPKLTLRSKEMKENFRTNLLLSILEFVKNDLQSELLFDIDLRHSERRKIHMLVAALNGEEDIKKREDFDNFRQFDIVREIHERNNYVLCTQSDGDPPNRQICIYKEAQENMYLVTPEDIRHNPEEEETNPFLRSITKHMKSDRGFKSDTPILDKLMKFFIEFSEEEYTEFRFLGPFLVHEIEAIGLFLGLIACLSKHQAPAACPEEMLKAFEKGTRYCTQEDINGYVMIKKISPATEMAIE